MYESAVDFIQNANLISFFIKAFGITLSVLYIFYTFIVIRQVASIKKTVIIKDRNIITTIAIAQLFIAVAIFAYALLIL